MTKDYDELKQTAESMQANAYQLSNTENFVDLSKVLFDLANVNSSISVHVSRLRRASKEAEERLKYEREKIKSTLMKSGMTVAQAESEKVVQTKELSDQYVVAYSEYSEARDYHEDVGRVLDFGRSRLAALRSEKDSLTMY
jgi:hypothetical protein